MNRIYQDDCIVGMRSRPAGTVDLAFADPPYNIGYDYDGEYNDNMEPQEYRDWSTIWMGEVHEILKPEGTFWLAIGDEWAADLQIVARELGFHLRSHVIWYYTFGMYSPRKYTRSHAHLLYFTKHRERFTFNDMSTRVPSARALVYNDSRANPDGRLPDDTWIIRPQELDEGAFPEFSDTWHIPRVAGTFNQRVDGAPNQMPEQLLGRIIRACSNEGDLVLDPFAGSGTTLAVAKKLGRRYLGYENSARFHAGASRRIQAANAGDALDGLLPQGHVHHEQPTG